MPAEPVHVVAVNGNFPRDTEVEAVFRDHQKITHERAGPADECRISMRPARAQIRKREKRQDIARYLNSIERESIANDRVLGKPAQHQ